MTKNKEPLLKIDSVCIQYDGIKAIDGVSFNLDCGELVSLIGANGAGKTSLLQAISGLVPLSSGKIFYQSEDLKGVAAHNIVKRNLCQVPEGRGVFSNLSVEENLDLGAWTSPKQYFAQDLERVYSLFPRLKERAKQAAGTLSGGEQQMLAMGRALMSRPQLLLLDEPSLGLAPQVIELIFQIIEQIHREGVSILLVEQNARQALRIADRGIVLELGKVTLEGKAKDLLESNAVQEAYLGDAFGQGS